MKRSLLLLTLPLMAFAAPSYKAEKATDHGVEVVHLADPQRGIEVSVAPGLGMRGYEMKVHGKNILYFPLPDVSALEKSRGLNGIPFLAPWANRMAGSGFWANGKHYKFNPDLGVMRIDQNGISIHGLLTTSTLWKVTEVHADSSSAHMTARLEFWKHPELMAEWPFAHEYEITYRLAKGELEVTTAIRNLSDEPMPVSIGFHPYFAIPDVPRNEWTAHIPAKKSIETDSHLVATGELKDFDLPDRITLSDHTFDNGYTDLVRGADGRAVFSVEGGGKKIEVIYGPKFQVGVVYAPPNAQFICFEPMAALTNGVNLAHDGKYSELQSVPAGGEWRETFIVRASGI
jgi:aldose 1-epimerase